MLSGQKQWPKLDNFSIPISLSSKNFPSENFNIFLSEEPWMRHKGFWEAAQETKPGIIPGKPYGMKVQSAGIHPDFQKDCPAPTFLYLEK